MRGLLVILTLYILNDVASSAKAAAHLFRSDYKYSEAIPGWFKFHGIPLIFKEAELRCHYEGAVLASPWTSTQKQEMISIMKSLDNDIEYKCTSVYTGIHATYSNGDFRTIQGKQLSEFDHKWANNLPKNYLNNATCISMDIKGLLHDENCGIVLPYICVRKDDKKVVISRECGTYDPAYKYKSETGHCYKFHNESATWSKAHMACESEQAKLVIINSKEESQVLKKMYDDFLNPRPGIDYISYAHIGFLATKGMILWRTIDGQTLEEAGFTTFAEGEPNNSNLEWCGSINKEGLLNDISCFQLAPFICELIPS